MKTAVTDSRAPRGGAVGTAHPGRGASSPVGEHTVDAPAERSADGRTRSAVVNLLLSDGPITAAALAERLGISAAAVRRHLDQLAAEGAITSREQPSRAARGRGRPARVYLLTAVGRERLPHGYDDIAVQAMRFLAETVGPDAVTAFARRRADELVAPYRDRLAATPDTAGKARILAEALNQGGFAASVQQVGVGQQLCQHHCPVGAVAQEFPQLCEAELEVLTRELGTYTQRLATIARGDAVCTTFIPIDRPLRRPDPATCGSPPAAEA